MPDDSDSEAVLISSIDNNKDEPNLCWKCRRISVDAVFARGGLCHSNKLDDVIRSAQFCSFCRLIQNGLRKDIADKLEEDYSLSECINIRPYVENVSRFGFSLRAGLRVWVQSNDTSCMFNWYLPNNKAISSPIRPAGLEKLHAARLWLEQSIQYFDKRSTTSTRWNDKSESSGNVSRSISSAFSPTRLLDLGSGPYYQPNDVRLVSHCSNLEYAALSHRWGDAQHLRTTHSSYLHHMFRISFGDLPETFKDAVIVTRFLGIRYLWIDALCIIQDDSIDWHREALLMGRIYQEALCSIAIHDSCDDSAGFLQQSLSAPVSIQLESTTVSPRTNFRAEVDRSGLSRRGWVLQERFLSNRTLHFTNESVFFEDARGVVTEEDAFTVDAERSKLLQHSATCVPPSQSLSLASLYLPPSTTSQSVLPLAIGDGTFWNQPDDESRSLQVQTHWPGYWIPRKRHIVPFNLSARLLNTSYGEGLKYQWFELVERYSQTQLTYESDRLPAIAGLAHVFQKHTGDHYISGIWHRTVHIGLLWYAVDVPLKRSKTHSTASWTWASINGAIQHPTSREFLKANAFISKSSRPEKMVFLNSASLLKIYAKMKCTHHLKPAPEGETTDAKHFFRGAVHPYQIFATSKPKSLIWFSPEKIEEEKRKQNHPSVCQIGFAVLDNNHPDELPLSNIWCIEMARVQGIYSTDLVDWVLLVTPSPSHPDCWCRVGVGVIAHDEGMRWWFEDVVSTTITLV